MREIELPQWLIEAMSTNQQLILIVLLALLPVLAYARLKQKKNEDAE